MALNTLPALPDLPQPTRYDQNILDGFEMHLDYKNASPRTQECYLDAGRLLARWSTWTGRAGLDKLTRTDLEAWVIWLKDEARTRRGQPYSEGYINNLYRSVQALFKYQAEHYDIVNPMAKMKPPKVDVKEVPVLSSEKQDAILKPVTKVKGFEARRDCAILWVFLKSGVRLSELTNMTVESVDLKTRSFSVRGKGGKYRTVRFTAEAGHALHLYLRERSLHKLTDLPNLWLGSNHRRPLTPNGIRQIITRRAKAVGLKINPHMFRHTFSHEWLDNGGESGDLMELNGWSSEQMTRRYGKSAAGARARRSYDRVMGR
jgi:site-specific recombinase XerD